MRKFYNSTSYFRLILAGIVFLVISNSASAQVKIGDNGATISPASLLELESTNKGLLIPRMPNTTAIDALNPPVGMLVYITTGSTGIYVRNPNGWERLTGFMSANAIFDNINVTGSVTAGIFNGNLLGNASTATNAQNALNATIATNLAGGSGGMIPYQSAANTTRLLPNGLAGQVLQSNGTSFAPSWVSPASLTSVDANDLLGTTLAANVINSSLTSVGILGGLTVSSTINGSINGNAATASALETPRRINNVLFDGNVDIVVPAEANTLTGNTINPTVLFSSLQSVGTLANLSVTNPIIGSLNGNATTATNIQGGAAGSIPVQTAAGATGMIPNGTANQILRSNGTTLTPTWVNPSIVSVGTATNLAGGAGGSIPYQNAAGATSMLGSGTPGQILQANGVGNAPTWVNTPIGDMTLAGNQTVTGIKTFGIAGNVGKLVVAGSVTGQTVIDASPTATGIAVLPPTGGVLATVDGIEDLTNKTINGNTITNGTGTLTLDAGSTLATSGGAFSTTLTATGNTTVTLPVAGTLATLGGTETLLAKTLTSPTINTPTVTGGTFTGPTLTNAALGTPASGVMTNVTGTATGLTAGHATSVAAGTAGQVLYQTGIGATGFVVNGTSGQVLTSAGSGAPTWTDAATGDMVLNVNQVVTAPKTFGLPGNVGQLIVAGNTTGITTINAQASAIGGTVILPNTGTLATLAEAEALTNKTINGNTITAGTGTLTLNNGTIAIATGSSLTTAGAFATVLTSTAATNVTFPVTGTLATLDEPEVLTNKTLTNPTVTTGSFTSPTLINPNLGTPSAGIMTNVTGTAAGLTSGRATNIAGGAVGEIPYQSAPDATSLLPIGTAGYVLQSNGSAAPSWVAAATGNMILNATQNVTGAKTFTPTSLVVEGTTSGSTIISGGAAATGTVILPEAGGTLATLGGTETLTNKTLTAPNLGTPTVLVGTNITGTAAALNIGGTAATATTSTNITGGAAASIPYQSTAGVTAMLANGNAGQVLQSNGTTLAPSWVNAATGNMILNATQNVTGAKTFTPTSLVVEGTTSGSTIISGGAAATGTVILPEAGGTLATLGGTETLTNKTLTAPNLGTPTVLVGTNITGTAAALNIGGTAATATTSTNITGGAAASIPYQSTAGVTAMLANGNAGQVLQSNGTTLAPSWVNAATGNMILNATQNVTGAKTFTPTSLVVEGTTSGSTIISGGAAATGTVILPEAGGTLATLGGTETLTNKTLTAPNLGTPTVLVGTNITGTAAALNIGGTAATATTSTNITGGAAASIPYQSTAGVTAMLANGNAGQVLQSNGTTLAPSWVNAATGNMILNATQNVTGAKTFTPTSLVVEGTTSGSTIISGGAAATGTVILPEAGGTLATLGGTETLTNKTLTAPNLGTPTVLVGTNITGTAAALNIGGTAATATTSTNITGGAAASIPYQSTAGVTAMLANGNAGQVLQSNGTTLAPSWVNAATGNMILNATHNVTGAKTFTPTSLVVEGTTSGSTIISGGAAATGTVILPEAGGTLATLGGTETLTNKTLTAPNLGTPTVLVGTNITGTAAALNIGGTAATATTSTNITGGAAASIPYQSTAGVTAMLANGNAGQVLQSNGTTLAPSWVNAATGNMILNATQNVTGAKTFTPTSLVVEGTTSGSTIISGGAAATGTVILPEAGGTLATLGGTETLTNKTLTAPNLGTPTVLVGTNITGTAAALNIGGTAATATTSTNITGGAAASIPYQSTAGVTAMLANGNAGQVLQSNGTTLAPSWVNAATGDMTLAGTQTIIGAKTFGVAGTFGQLIVAGNTTGSTIIAADPTSASGTAILPAAGGTLATLDGGEILTNKILTSPTLNNPTLNSPTLVTPTLGAATATTINRVTITQPATAATLTIANNQTLTVAATASVSGTNTGDQIASGVDFTPAGTIASINVQAALAELDGDIVAKAPLASPVFTGVVTIPSPFTLGATSVTSTAAQLNYLNAATGTTGTTTSNIVYSAAPTLVTPILGDATTTSLRATNVALGNALGTGSTNPVITGSNTAGLITVDQDGTVTAGNPIITVNLTTTFPTGARVILTPANAVTAALGASGVWTSATTNSFAIRAGTNVPGNNSYAWNYLVIGY